MEKLVPRSPDARLREFAQTALAELPPLVEAMTAADLAAHRAAMMKMLGTGANVTVKADDWKGNVLVGLTEDFPSGETHYVHAAAWPEGIVEARAWIASRAVIRRDTLIRRMALAIIDLTDQYHLCDESALRRVGFTSAKIAEVGDLACWRAGEMAGNRPFAIVPSASP